MATVGRKPRKRKPGAGTAVSVRSHTRTPRGPNRGKPPVRVKSYKRGLSKRKKRQTKA